MKKYWLGCLLLITLQSTYAASKVESTPSKPSYNWSGYYVGVPAGAVLGHFDVQTSSNVIPLFPRTQATVINNAGQQNIYERGFISGIEGGYNWQFNKWLLGLATDLQTLSINGTSSSYAIHAPGIPDYRYVVSSYGNANWLFSARPRVGYIVNNWLFYATGGLGLTLLQSDFLFTDNHDAFQSGRISILKPGYVVGAGVETGLSDQISVKAEYRYSYFNNTKANTMSYNLHKGHIITNFVNLKLNSLQLGINYHFNNQATGLLYPELLPRLFDSQQWQTEIGIRAFASSGTIGVPQPLLNGIGSNIVSRLTFADLDAFSGETFARVDHKSGLFAKTFLGAGSVRSGELNDEDFPAGDSYSNTSSDVWGNLSYATVDAGYSFIKSMSAKTGAFIGYNYNAQNVGAYGCRQLAGSTVCTPNGFYSNFLGISEEDRFDSLRLGLSSEFNITDQLSLTSEAAYLPFVGFNGHDDHNARQLIISEHAGRGDGAMLESVLGYQLSSNWNAGLGARYWMWNTHNGTVTFNFLGKDTPSTQNARFNSERYGLFLQLNYGNKKAASDITYLIPSDWKGIYIGGHLGGGWSNSSWSDPFTSGISPEGRTNVAGFGDKIQSTGPLGGGNVNLNWQSKQWVYGAGTSISVTDVRGENTLFSGLGGMNGRVINHYLGTLYGKLGSAYNNSLFYANAGPAVLNTNYVIDGNNNISDYGTQSKTVTHWGWTVGAGIEHTLTPHWTTGIEYNYVNIPRFNVSYPLVEFVNAHDISVHQTMNLFKLNLNYKV